eukprot:CAMPEP_0170066716 /NCGR_PEP_ID=MMETSP0019_2-20121128/6312_1 /TAXON_ID=98059 /ORGANISM="Dinobryon sp., Strain UTEXLB2267" /LENGTH=480 /DNA_ID=CAMNT_0010273881 /DNA_START=843 /DNA_END=2282 /DNA_ORIENTATION=+
MKNSTVKLLASISNEIDITSNTSTLTSTTQNIQTVKETPNIATGWTMFEFFSGIGGMRLALPEHVNGMPIRKIVAFDINTIANQIYQHNFLSPSSSLSPLEESVCCVGIDGLKLSDVDGKADLWTLSPPCQPFTLTRGALQRDHLDHRCKALFRLMHLLLQMRQLPRFIVLENVVGFVHSRMRYLWRQVMRRCGYACKEMLLSPHTAVGLPNSRRRYYFIAEHSSVCVSRLLTPIASELTLSDPPQPTDSNHDICTSLPAAIRALYPSEPCTIGECLATRSLPSAPTPSSLWVPEQVLCASWAGALLSIVGPCDRRSFCFTKSYGGGRVWDRSAGSLFYPLASGPLAEGNSRLLDRLKGVDDEKEEGDEEEEEVGDGDDDSVESDEVNPSPPLLKSSSSHYKTSFTDSSTPLTQQQVSQVEKLRNVLGQVRLFDPDELLALSGFPVTFSWPENIALKHRFACIGNSINVRVVSAVMKCLF